MDFFLKCYFFSNNSSIVTSDCMLFQYSLCFTPQVVIMVRCNAFLAFVSSANVAFFFRRFSEYDLFMVNSFSEYFISQIFMILSRRSINKSISAPVSAFLLRQFAIFVDTAAMPNAALICLMCNKHKGINNFRFSN